MVAVPSDEPHTTPVAEPTLTDELDELQTPPVTPSVNVVHAPLQILPAPDIAVGDIFTVTLVVTTQPPATV